MDVMNSTDTPASTQPVPTPDTGHAPHPVRDLRWRLIAVLAAVALVRPAIHVGEHLVGATVAEWIPFGITVAITAVWVAVVGGAKVRYPLSTLIATGLTYVVYTAVLGLVGGLLLMGAAQGPLTDPISFPGIIVTNLIWGIIAGALATLVQRVRGVPVQPWRIPRPSTKAGRVAWSMLVGILGLLGGAMLALVATDMSALFLGRDGVTAEPARTIIGSLVPVLALLGLIAAFPLHHYLRDRGDRRRTV